MQTCPGENGTPGAVEKRFELLDQIADRGKGREEGLASGRTEVTRVLGGQSQRVCLEPGHRDVGAGGSRLRPRAPLFPPRSLKEKQEEGGSRSRPRGRWDRPAPAGAEQPNHSLSRRPHAAWGFRKWPVPAPGLLASTARHQTDETGARPHETPGTAETRRRGMSVRRVQLHFLAVPAATHRARSSPLLTARDAIP